MTLPTYAVLVPGCPDPVAIFAHADHATAWADAQYPGRYRIVCLDGGSLADAADLAACSDCSGSGLLWYAAGGSHPCPRCLGTGAERRSGRGDSPARVRARVLSDARAVPCDDRMDAPREP